VSNRVEIDGVSYELGGAMLEVVNCASRVAEFSLLLTGKHAEAYWLTGTVEPAPRDLDDVAASRLRVREPIEALFAALTGKHRPISLTNPGGVLLRAQRQGPRAFYLSSSFDFVALDPDPRRAVIEVTAHVVGFHDGVPQ